MIIILYIVFKRLKVLKSLFGLREIRKAAIRTPIRIIPAIIKRKAIKVFFFESLTCLEKSSTDIHKRPKLKITLPKRSIPITTV